MTWSAAQKPGDRGVPMPPCTSGTTQRTSDPPATPPCPKAQPRPSPLTSYSAPVFITKPSPCFAVERRASSPVELRNEFPAPAARKRANTRRFCVINHPKRAKPANRAPADDRKTWATIRSPHRCAPLRKKSCGRYPTFSAPAGETLRRSTALSNNVARRSVDAGPSRH